MKKINYRIQVLLNLHISISCIYKEKYLTIINALMISWLNSFKSLLCVIYMVVFHIRSYLVIEPL